MFKRRPLRVARPCLTPVAILQTAASWSASTGKQRRRRRLVAWPRQVVRRVGVADGARRELRHAVDAGRPAHVELRHARVVELRLERRALVVLARHALRRVQARRVLRSDSRNLVIAQNEKKKQATESKWVLFCEWPCCFVVASNRPVARRPFARCRRLAS